MPANTTWFTPEYSSELLRLVEEIYVDDIRPHYAVIKLEDLHDLMDHTKYLYDSFLEEMKNNNKQDALTAYIIGCYFLYLIIPQSTQFQARNKTFHVHNALKKLYENQVNMTNVLLMVKDEIDSVLDRDLRKLKDVERTRAFSSGNELSSEVSRLTLADKESVLPKVHNKSDFARSDGNVHSQDIENIPLWSAPNLEPNDQLKLSLDSAVLSSSSVDTVGKESPELSLSPVECSKHKSKSELTMAENEQPEDDTYVNDQQHFWDAKVDRAVAHRKDSYHSVYMDDGDHDFDGYDDSKGTTFPQNEVQAMKRLQKQSIITSPELFSILSNQNERSRLLLIDLRLQSRYKFNSILAPNMVFIDPRLLWDFNTKTPVSDISVLEGRLKSSVFNKRGSFDFIVYYTDMKTYMDMDFDYLFVFYNLVVTAQEAPVRSLPSYLLGGYEKWKAVLKKYLTQFGIRVDDYLYRPYADNKDGSEKSANAKPIDPVPWKPPALPERIRNLPVPPSPASLPVTKEMPPPVPPKIQLEKQEHIKHNRPKSHTVSSAVRVPKDKAMPELNQLASYPMRQRQFSVPTIERSSNKYVALSITGLRNLGATCYVNSILQCLFATRMFRDLFEPSNYEKFFNRGLQDSGKLSNSFAVLIRKMYMNGGCSVVPTSFLKVCNYLRPDFNIPDDQQDAQEFLMLAIDRLHDELSNQNEVLNAYPELLLYDDTTLKVQKEEYKQWFENSLMKSKFSPIDRIFQGQLENGLHCKRCGYSSYSYSTFYILSLAIPKHSSNFLSSNKGNWVNLEDCINMFTSDEIMSGENAWDCPKCGATAQKEKSESSRSQSHKHRHSFGSSGSPEPRKVKKKDEEGSSFKSKTKSLLFPKRNKLSSSKSLSPFSLLSPGSSNTNSNNGNGNGGGSRKNAYAIRATNFVTLPPVLVIHLSRFYYDLTKKNETVITYPLILNIVLKNNETLKYKLYGVVNHNGNLISGHYTSLVNKNRDHDLENDHQQWYYFDDEVVKHETKHGNLSQGINKVSSKDVYVLFYERID